MGANKIADKLREVTAEESAEFLRYNNYTLRPNDRIVSFECWNCERRYLTPAWALTTNIGKMCPQCAWDDEN